MNTSYELQLHLGETKQTRTMPILMTAQSDLIEEEWTGMITDGFHQTRSPSL